MYSGYSGSRRLSVSKRQCTLHRVQVGVTLYELLIVIALLGIIIGVAIPSYVATVARNNLATDNNDLISSMHYARSLAITRGATVTVCSANADLTGCSMSNDWSAGWVIAGADGDILHVREPLSDNVATEQITTGAIGSVTFNRSGFTRSARTIMICNANGRIAAVRGLVIGVDGRVRSAADNNNDQISEDANGNNLAC